MEPESQVHRSFGYRHRQGILMAMALSAMTAVLAIVMPPRHVDAAALSTTPPAGRMWASNCFQCHGTDGQSGSISQIAGSNASDLYNKLKDQQTHKSIMGSQARGYTDAELREIAKYFASIPKK